MGRPRTEEPSAYAQDPPPPATPLPPPTPESYPPYPPPSPAQYSTQHDGATFPAATYEHNPSGEAYPPQKLQLPQEPAATPYPPTNAPYPPPQPVAFPPPNPVPHQLGPLASAAPQPVNFPPNQNYTSPPVFVQNASVATAAPGFPVQQPGPKYASAGMPGRIGPPGTEFWSTGLFDCMDDPTNAVMTLCVPCITFGQIAEIVDEGASTCSTSGMMYGCVAFLIALPCLISCPYRTRLRAKFDLVEAPAPDWVTHFLCEWCALCQEYRELRNRGLDPAIGWQGNVARMQRLQQGVVMTPPMNQVMTG